MEVISWSMKVNFIYIFVNFHPKENKSSTKRENHQPKEKNISQKKNNH
jgi:hypothetical protein